MKKNTWIQLRISDSNKAKIQQKADASKMSISKYILNRVFGDKPQTIKKYAIDETPAIEKGKFLQFLEEQIKYLNQIAWQFISKDNKFDWNAYKQLWNHPIWFLGVKTREKIEELKTGETPMGAFHHEPPYRNHLLTLFTTGKFVENHEKGRINK